MPSAAEQVARVEAIAAAVESPTFSVQFGPNGPQWCSDDLLARDCGASRAPAGASTCISWRRAISAPSPTAPIREGVVARLKRSACFRRG